MVESGGTYILDSGAVLAGNENNTGSSSAGVVVSNGGRLEMKGTAEIRGNTVATTDHSGAAVYIETGAEFILIAGFIKSNNINIHFDEGASPVSPEGKVGTVYIAPGGTFTMRGGSIAENTIEGILPSATGDSGIGTFPFMPRSPGSAGVFVDGGEFILQAGSITENSGGSISNGGVWVENGIFRMMGGEITKNSHAYDSYNGGVWVKSGTIYLYKGNISGNTSKRSEEEQNVYPSGKSGIPYYVEEE
jgi:hypothetical protein